MCKLFVWILLMLVSVGVLAQESASQTQAGYVSKEMGIEIKFPKTGVLSALAKMTSSSHRA